MCAVPTICFRPSTVVSPGADPAQGQGTPYTWRTAMHQPHLDCRSTLMKRKTMAACCDGSGSSGVEAVSRGSGKQQIVVSSYGAQYCYHDNGAGDEVIGRPWGPLFLSLADRRDEARPKRSARLSSAAQERVSHFVLVTSQELTMPSLYLPRRQ
jgi:hypothetical protein